MKHHDADRLARELAARTGEGITEAVSVALRERLERIKRGRPISLTDEMMRIGIECAALPEIDAAAMEKEQPPSCNLSRMS